MPFSGMDPLALFLSSRGRVAPRPFWLGTLAIYVAGFASQALLSASVTGRSGLWPFIAAQVTLIWAWLALHIKRLRDAGRATGPAVGIAIIYALALGLMLLVMAFFTGVGTAAEAEKLPGNERPAGTAISLMLVVLIFGILFSEGSETFVSIVKILVLIACLPALISFAFSIWTGTRPAADATPPPPAGPPPA